MVTRDDLPAAVQACQAIHAALEFALRYPAIAGDWHANSSTLVLLATPDELSLGRLGVDAASFGLHLTRFYEPDLGHALTAFAVESAAHRLLAHLPLALSQRGEVRT